jgi:hypothetical protein
MNSLKFELEESKKEKHVLNDVLDESRLKARIIEKRKEKIEQQFNASFSRSCIGD